MRSNFLFAGFAAALATASASYAEDSPLVVESATAIVAYPGAPSGAAFIVIRNTGDEPDWLILAETDAAARAELHTHTMDSEGVMRMREADGGFPLPAGGAVEMVRGGEHVMLMGLQDVSPGDTITIELTFVSGEALAVDVPVTSPAE